MSSYGLNADMETSASLVNAITDDAVFLYRSHINHTTLFTHTIRHCLKSLEFCIK